MLFDVEKSIARFVWLPKSQIRDGQPTAWIIERKREELKLEAPANAGGMDIRFFDADGNEIETVANGANKFDQLAKLNKMIVKKYGR